MTQAKPWVEMHIRHANTIAQHHSLPWTFDVSSYNFTYKISPQKTVHGDDCALSHYQAAPLRRLNGTYDQEYLNAGRKVLSLSLILQKKWEIVILTNHLDILQLGP